MKHATLTCRFDTTNLSTSQNISDTVSWIFTEPTDFNIKSVQVSFQNSTEFHRLAHWTAIFYLIDQNGALIVGGSQGTSSTTGTYSLNDFQDNITMNPSDDRPIFTFDKGSRFCRGIALYQLTLGYNSTPNIASMDMFTVVQYE